VGFEKGTHEVRATALCGCCDARGRVASDSVASESLLLRQNKPPKRVVFLFWRRKADSKGRRQKSQTFDVKNCPGVQFFSPWENPLFIWEVLPHK